MERKSKETNESRCVPLPVQNFLWRQTNPFLGPKIGKLHEASCVTFERVVVQNILHGLSPNLSEAIKSIPRWRFVRTAFPHIVHCCSALLNERSDAEQQSGRLSQSLQKMLYVLHWLVLDAAAECSDSDNGAPGRRFTQEEILEQHLFPLHCIQLFVYMLVPVIKYLTPTDISENIRLEGGLTLWQCLWNFQQPDILCFAAPVKPKASQMMSLPVLKRTLEPSLASKNIYMGGSGPRESQSSITSRPHRIVSQSTEPPSKASVKKLQKKPSLMSMFFGEKRGADADGRDVRGLLSKRKKNGEEGINLDDIGRHFEYIEEGLSDTVDCSDRAPLVQLTDLCGNTWSIDDVASPASYTHYETVCEICDSALYPSGTSTSPCQCDSVPAGDAKSDSNGSPGIELKTLRKTLRPMPTTDSLLSSLGTCSYVKMSSPSEVHERVEVCDGQYEDADLLPEQRSKLSICKPTDPVSPRQKDGETIGSLISGTPVSQVLGINNLQASYMDVAALRCLFIKQWAEEGVSWALNYFLNRLNSICTDMHGELTSHKKSLSLPDLANLDHPEVSKADLKSQGLAGNAGRPVAAKRRGRTAAKKPFLRRLPKEVESRSSGSQTPCAAPGKTAGGCLKRSVTDSEISYFTEYLTEAMGSAPFILKNGDLNLCMVVRAVAEVTSRPMSTRVCDGALRILDLVIQNNYFEEYGPPQSPGVIKSGESPVSNFVDAGMKAMEVERASKDNVNGYLGESSFDEYAAGYVFFFTMEALLKILIYLGCPNGCADSSRDLQTSLLRNQAKTDLIRIQKSSPLLFSIGMLNFVNLNELSKVVDLLHAVLLFCSGDSVGMGRSSIRAPRDGRFRAETQQKFSYKNMSTQKDKGIDGIIAGIVLKTLVIKMVDHNEELKQPENSALYYDVRSLMNFLQVFHGHPFRMVELSALLDTLKSCSIGSDGQAAKAAYSTADSDSESSRMASPATSIVKSPAQVTNRSRGKQIRDDDDADSISPRYLYSDVHASPSPHLRNGRKKNRKLPLSLNILKSVRSDSQLQCVTDDADNSNSDQERSADDLTKDCSDQKKRKKLLFLSSFVNKNVKSSRKHALLGVDMEDRDSVDENEAMVLRNVTIPPKRAVNIDVLRDGIRKFSFMLETCRPGTVPDAPLVAALLDLKAPVISRAAILVECCYFVHLCNKGLWPDWMRTGQPVKSLTSSIPLARGTPSVLRGASILQKQAGLMFYQWALALSAKLDNMMNHKVATSAQNNVLDQKLQLRIMDDLEDFFDEGIVNQSSEECPPALQLIACTLLLEITGFLRESYQDIIRSRTHYRKNSKFERFQSQRRWSVLSATFSPSRNSDSLQSIPDWSTTGPLPSHPERRISFCTLEEDHVSSESHVTSEEPPAGDRKGAGRRSLSGIQKMLKHSSLIPRRQSMRSGKKDYDQDRRSQTRHTSFASGDYKAPETESNEVLLTTSKLVSNESLPRETTVTDVGSQSHESDSMSMKSFPWTQTVLRLAGNFNFACTHYKACHPLCFERCYRQCQRLMMGLRQVYGEQFDISNSYNRRKALLFMYGDKQKGKIPNKKTIRDSLSQSQEAMSSTQLSDRCEQGSTLKLKGSEKHSTQETKIKMIPCCTYRRTRSYQDSLKEREDNELLSYLKTKMRNPSHAPLSTFLKAMCFVSESDCLTMIRIGWSLLLEPDHHLAAAAASTFIACAVKVPSTATEILNENLLHKDPAQRIASVQRFHALWKNRYQVWLMMEDKANAIFKTPPPNIDFSMPSPPVGLPQMTIVDPSWMPHVKTNLQELKLREDTMSQSIMTMTKTRRKQKQELVKRAMQHAEEAKSAERAKFRLTGTAVVQQAAFEPSLFQLTAVSAIEEEDGEPHAAAKHVTVSPLLFPSVLCSAAVHLIEMLDDDGVDSEGTSVSETADHVVWSCIVEDSALFFRHIFEKLTNYEKQEYMIALLRKLILHYDTVPPQTAYVLLNYMIGFIMFYYRSPSKETQEAIARGILLLCTIVQSVRGVLFKDLKQTLRKEQCDGMILITANMPMAKKIIVHGPDADSIPTQVSAHELTQFSHLFSESCEFFNILPECQRRCFLIDAKTGFLHRPHAYVRDYYFFRRSHYPELKLVYLDLPEAKAMYKKSAFARKSFELGQVLFTLSMLRHCPEVNIPQRVFFLHEELTKLPSFPRKALEPSDHPSDPLWDPDLLSMDGLTKLSWQQLMHLMLRSMEYTFGDLHLFINVVNGIMILHCENASILRHCMAAYIEMACQYKAHFSSHGFFTIMPTILRCFSHYQTNPLLCGAIRFTCKQFYILHRKPFILQMFGSVASILDFNENEQDFSLMQVKTAHFYDLLASMEKMDWLNDDLDIMALVQVEKPLKALDLCYKDDQNTFSILTDALACCITISAYAPETRRSYQMLVVLQAILPYFLKDISERSKLSGNDPAVLRAELQMLYTLNVEMKTLIECCDVLARNFSGPQRAFDIVNASGPVKSFADSPQLMDIREEPIIVKAEPRRTAQWESSADSEVQREMFRKPRDALLSLAATFLKRCLPRVRQINQILGEVSKVPEILDQKTRMKLTEIAYTLLKLAPYDSNTMSCDGLQRYFLDMLPISDWSEEQNRSALNNILRRLDKTIAKIVKRSSMRRRIDWNAVSNWLQGLYKTLTIFPYISNFSFLKATVQLCLKALVGDTSVITGSQDSSLSMVHGTPQTILPAFSPPDKFCSTVIKLTLFMMQALGEQSFSLEYICSQETLGTQCSERIETVTCNVLLPLFFEIASNEKYTLRKSDIQFCLNYLLNAVSPSTIRSTLAPAAYSMPFGRSESMYAQGDRPSATPVPTKGIRDSVYQTCFLTLKVMSLSFENHMATEWCRIAKLTKELGVKRLGGSALWSFIDFVISSPLPLRVLLQPFVQHKIMHIKNQSELEQQWLEVLRVHLTVPEQSLSTYKNEVLLDLSSELKALKEDLSSRPIVENSGRNATEHHPDAVNLTLTSGKPRFDSSRGSLEARPTSSIRLSRISPVSHRKATEPAKISTEDHKIPEELEILESDSTDRPHRPPRKDASFRFSDIRHRDSRYSLHRSSNARTTSQQPGSLEMTTLDSNTHLTRSSYQEPEVFHVSERVMAKMDHSKVDLV